MNFTGAGTDQFHEFAISLVPNQESVILPELVKFYLYPRMPMEPAYFYNYTLQIGFRFYRYSIYYATSMFDDGFRLVDLPCYAKIVEFYRSSSLVSINQRLIQVKSDLYGVQNVSTFGFISIVTWKKTRMFQMSLYSNISNVSNNLQYFLIWLFS